MLKKYVAFFLIAMFLTAFMITTINMQVFGWSNGGYSADPSHPDYGTHDWIAQHALDWLPLGERQLILSNLAAYLYGTELPDNGNASDGIGDTANHHVYYFANGTLQDDASAVRAQEEYYSAFDLFKIGDLVNASKRLGVMTHYISDVAVFGHVMGAVTDWGSEIHHSDYENHVNTMTNNYTGEFNVFLKFDGVLNDISAYNATLMLAHDTTFDTDGNFTCIWMDQNYNWSNPIFKNRCGESLNLAVNLITDVLHTFFSEMDSSAHFIPVPFYYQEKDYYCGPACLAMVFDYYGENISQEEIADVARTIGDHVDSTFTDELLRAAHFSNISTSKGDEIPENITGYTLRKLGYAAFEDYGMNLTQLKSYIDQDKPLILLMWYSAKHVSGHFRVVTGYNETHIFLHDPWNNVTWGGAYGGPNLAMNYTTFLDRWSYSGYWALYTSPWNISVSAPSYIKPQTSFQINATITYPQPLPNAPSDYPTSSCNATIILPANLTLAQGETLKKTLDTGSLQAGATAKATWMLTANSSGTYTVSVEAEGLVSGSVGTHYNYTAYDYTDRIGAAINFTMQLGEDSNAPSISNLSRMPNGDVSPSQEVKVSANVTDSESGIKNATLYYDLNNSQAWTPIPMNYNSTAQLYYATIPGQPIGTHVTFHIVAYDKVGNNATEDGTEYSAYTVVPEFSPSIIMSLFMILTILVIVYAKKKNASRRRVHREPSNCRWASLGPSWTR
jgi:uncharacterized protein YvpB